MKKRVVILGFIFTVIVGFTFSYGIFKNPSFNLYDFFASLSSEFIGWILAVTVFQYYYDEKMTAKKESQKKSESTLSLADELLKLKELLDSGVITQQEFDNIKNRMLAE